MNTNLTPRTKLAEILEEIQRIKIKYGFREDFELLEHLELVKNWLESIEAHEKQSDIIKEKKKNLKKIIHAITKLIKSLNHDFDFVKHEVFIVTLEIQKENFEKELKSLATIPRGHPAQSSSYRCAALLLKIFRNGTAKEDESPRTIKCWNPTKKINQNNLYGFINNILPLMHKMGLKIKASNETIIEYASDIVSPLYSKEFTPRSFQIDIDQETFQSIDKVLEKNTN